MTLEILLVGCGKMGAAMLERMAAPDIDARFTVIEPTAPTTKPANVNWHTDLNALAADYNPSLILLAVKPQVMPSVLPLYKRFTGSLFVSIAAGLTLVKLAELLGNPKAAIIRAMPNLPASVGAGMTALISNPQATAEQRGLCEKLLGKTGAIAWLQREDQMDAVTALSGSGPAYLFALCETLAKVGEQLGLPPELAALLARQTVIGSGALLAGSDQTAAALRQAVTSPKGTTEAALQQLLADDGLLPLLNRTMQAAAARSKALAQ